jgi:hypothetical protein
MWSGRKAGLRILLAASILPVSGLAFGQSLYSIGNSLTFDSHTDAIAKMAAQRGHSLEYGYHVRNASALDYISSNPSDVSVGRGGTFDQALPGSRWDYLTLEPYGSATSTLSSDVAAIKKIAALANAGSSNSTSVYIYAAWPAQFQTQGNFSNYWEQPLAGGPNQPTVLADAYFDELYQRLNEGPDATAVHVIPIGDVFDRLDHDIRAGLFPGISSVDAFYRDTIHMGDAGQFIAGTTLYATIFGEDPTGIAIPDEYLVYGSGNVTLTPELARQLQSVIWDVVSHDPRTGVTAVPLPAAAWLLLSGLATFAAAAARRGRVRARSSFALVAAWPE